MAYKFRCLSLREISVTW